MAAGATVAADGVAVATMALSPAAHREHKALERRIGQLEHQIGALRWERRVLATWHAIHIPIGMAMFVVAFTHIAATIYYSTLLR